MQSRRWTQTAGRVVFDYMRPSFEGRTMESIIHEIAHHLSHINRFNGATRTAYSVAQHSVHVAELLYRRGPSRMPDSLTERDRRYLALCGLLHDAHEAYCGDVTTPIKAVVGPAWAIFEGRIQQAVENYFGVNGALACVKWADRVLLATEARDLYIGGPVPEYEQWLTEPPLTATIRAWSADTAKREFLKMFELLRQ